MTFGSRVISFLSGEWMLTCGRPNGGDVVVFRTLWVGTLLISVMAAIQATGDISTSMCGTVSLIWAKALLMLRGTQGPLVYGAVYVALYARFTSQWTYMANLYNQIKQTEISQPEATRKIYLAQWKAGYIEDAYVTHMATKPMVTGVIRAWYLDPDVKSAFIDHTSNHSEIIGWLIEHKVLKMSDCCS